MKIEQIFDDLRDYIGKERPQGKIVSSVPRDFKCLKVSNAYFEEVCQVDLEEYALKYAGVIDEACKESGTDFVKASFDNVCPKH